MAITQAVTCSVEGFEDVTVIYNMMTDEEHLEQFVVRLARGGSHEGVIDKVEGWPEGYGEPFGKKTPMAFLIWCAKDGLRKAIEGFVSDPN